MEYLKIVDASGYMVVIPLTSQHAEVVVFEHFRYITKKYPNMSVRVEFYSDKEWHS